MVIAVIVVYALFNIIAAFWLLGSFKLAARIDRAIEANQEGIRDRYK